ncbi:hypothetical protein C8Q80DRAFT_1124801 [Daedaleopsis nitida]|nr:hypothetical protein C8Q80DRAFT_1124801 [Daedaleopsis nitida]
MASPTSIQLAQAELIAEFQAITVGNYCAMAAEVLFFYHCIASFPREVKLYWRRKVNGGTTLYYSNQYFYLLVTLLTISSGSLPFTDKRQSTSAFLRTTCDLFAKATFGIQTLSYIPWAMFSTLRTLALTRRLSLAVLVFVLSAAPTVVNLSRYYYHISGSLVPDLGCQPMDNVDTKTTEICPRSVESVFTDLLVVVIVSRCSLILSDGILIFITWSTVRRRAAYHINADGEKTLAGILWQDGILYFVSVLVLTLHSYAAAQLI